MKKVFLTGWILILSALVFSQAISPDKPTKGKWDLHMKKIWEIENAGKEVFGSIQQIEVNDDGRVYVLDSKNFKIFIFNKDGKFLSEFGQKGEGPGEIRNLQMGNQLFAIGDSIIIADRGRIHYFSRNGIFKKTVIYPGQLKPRIFVSEDIFVSAPAIVDDPRNREAKIKLFDLKNNKETIITTYTPFEKATAAAENRGNQVILAIVIDGITPLMLVKYHQGNIYYGMSNQYQINVVNLEGKHDGSFGIESRKPKRISGAYKKELEQQFSDVPQDMVKRIIDGLPESATFFSDLTIDRNRFIYLFVSDPENKSQKAVDIFSPQGNYLYSSEIQVSAGVTISSFTMKDDLLFIAIEDDEGNLEVSKYTLQLPDN